MRCAVDHYYQRSPRPIRVLTRRCAVGNVCLCGCAVLLQWCQFLSFSATVELDFSNYDDSAACACTLLFCLTTWVWLLPRPPVLVTSHLLGCLYACSVSRATAVRRGR